ncbi:hypothetical protein R1sor_006074 [Riccia sorocarpa]|uniref:Uncharacterized protein n=1 Tax=Riccia sorocarpa TaxID=122646 RepID=A0ABD3HLW9_9MARC
MNFVQLLRQQTTGAHETSRRGDMQPMEEDLQSAATHDHFPISLALATPEMVTFSSIRGASYFKVDHTILQDNHLLEQLKEVWARLDQHPEFSICSYLQAWQEQLQMIQARQQTRDRQLKLLPGLERQLAQLHDANDFSPGIVQQIAELSAQVARLRELQ